MARKKQCGHSPTHHIPAWVRRSDEWRGRYTEAELAAPDDLTCSRCGAQLQECFGEAHRNPYIDHCMVCLPGWGWVAKKEEP